MSFDLYLTLMIRFFIGFILLAAAWGKVQGFQQFAQNLNTSFYFPKKLSKLASSIIIMVELLLAFILLTAVTNIKVAMQISLVLFSCFTVVVGYFMLKYESVRCNCFGRESRPVSSFDLIRNIIIIMAIVYSLVMGSFNIGVDAETTFLLAILGFILTILIINFHEIVLILAFRGKA